jgi:hypothetical protein
MTDHPTVLTRMRPCSPTRAPSSPATWVLNSPPGRLAYRGSSSPAHEERSDRGRCSASRAGGLDLRLRRLPHFSPALSVTVRRPFRALVRVEMITPRICSPAVLRTPSPETTRRCLEKPEPAGRGAAGISRTPELDRPAEGTLRCSKSGGCCDPGAEPLAGSAAGSMARSSSGGSSPVVRPAHAPRGVAG